jgi:poly(3-hydroxybutyrate) depolymerase
MRVMKHGPDVDVVAIATEARRDHGTGRRPVALCVVHGADDDVVAPRNAVELVRQYLALNDHPVLAGEAQPAAARDLPPADRETQEVLSSGRTVTTREWVHGGVLAVRYVSVAGLGHAWSGGDAAYPYNDALPPAATEILARFATEVAG